MSTPHLPWWTNATTTFVPGHGLGCRPTPIPFPRLSMPGVVTIPFVVNKSLNLPRQYIPRYDQGAEGACTGFMASWMQSIDNQRFYAARKLYLEAQLVDEWADTPPEEGSSIVAVAKVLRDQGHWRFARGVTFLKALEEGIDDFRLIASVDEYRRAIAGDRPVGFAMPWMENYDKPEWIDPGSGGSRWWIGRGALGQVRGYHAICSYGCRDDIQAGKFVNSWGIDTPLVNMPYDTMHWHFERGLMQGIIFMDRIKHAHV